MKVDCGYTENYLKEQNRMTGNCEIDCKDCPLVITTTRPTCYVESLKERILTKR